MISGDLFKTVSYANSNTQATYHNRQLAVDCFYIINSSDILVVANKITVYIMYIQYEIQLTIVYAIMKYCVTAGSYNRSGIIKLRGGVVVIAVTVLIITALCV